MSSPTLHFVLPGDPRTVTGGYIYDRRIVEGLRELGWQVQVHALDESFPSPSNAALAHAQSTLAGISTGALVVIDGLALGAMPELVAAHTGRLRLVALIHHPLADETGLRESDRARLARSEPDALAQMAKVIVTSPWTLRRLTDAGLPAERLHIVSPGTDPAPPAQGSGGEALQLLCVATLTPRKGHAVLFDALAQLRNRPWHLRCAGSIHRDVMTVRALRERLESLALRERIQLLGELTPKALGACYASADLFVLASHVEGYGMAHAEALSYGLPIVATAAGAVPETVPPDAARLVPPGDSRALAQALAEVMDDPDLRGALARGARRGREALPTWPQSSARFDAELRALL